jgi:single stranded DNA-binding protein
MGAKIIVTGNIGKDPILKTVKTHDGRDVACVNFSIADNTRVKAADGKWVKKTDWYKVVLWDGAAKALVENCKSGKQLTICGLINRVEYIDKKDGTKVRDIEIKPLTVDYGPDSRKNSTYEGQNTGEATPAHATPPPAAPPVAAAPIPTLPPAPPGFSWAFMNSTHVLIPTPPAASAVAPPAPTSAQPEMVVISGV